MAQAREPAFYTDFGVADTPEGRYELIALHLVLALDRLGQPGVADELLRQKTLETFVADMDDAMRQMGAGDPSVPRKVKRAAAGVYDRNLSYREALANNDDRKLSSALAEHVYRGIGTPHLESLTAYVRRASKHLAALPADQLRSGRLSFPHPKVHP